MKIHNLERASDNEVCTWLFNKIPDLSPYQKEAIRQNEIVRFSKFYFYKKRQKSKNILIRLTVLFVPFVWIILFLSLPVAFIISGRWGYNKIEWFDKWINSVGL